MKYRADIYPGYPIKVVVELELSETTPVLRAAEFGEAIKQAVAGSEFIKGVVSHHRPQSWGAS